MNATKLSCGLLVLHEVGELLVGHSTENFISDLPKGLIDEGEDAMTCALREAREEFGLVFRPERLTDLGRQPYYSGKDLHLFAVQTSTLETRVDDLRCTSFFEHPVTNKTMLEIDGFAWANNALLGRRLGKSMKRLLLDSGLLAKARQAVNPASSQEIQMKV